MTTDRPMTVYRSRYDQRLWLLKAAARLDLEGEHQLAAEARAEAAALLTPPAPRPTVVVRCEVCDRPASPPDDWPYDWYNHAACVRRGRYGFVEGGR